ncbi:hypothetical protein FHS42_006920 [Streptomyces zagrosensis]|uniref:Uncharacterized protein n=1 Tax=Streptomyces zagrosensis TaxID=1042984 RepID=A0A7W9V3F2_9ACTN|nr:hypothetical protein [Streptomyces zagrosensis]
MWWLVPGRPVTERVGEFGDTGGARGGGPGGGAVVCGRVVAQGAYGVPDADHWMSGGGEDSGQQPGPPLGEHLAPGPFVQLTAEVVGPVREVPGVTQRVPPGDLGDPRYGVRPVLQLAAVVVEPAMDHDRLTVSDQCFHRHRRMVGKPASAFWAGGVEAFESFVESAARVVHDAQARQRPVGPGTAAGTNFTWSSRPATEALRRCHPGSRWVARACVAPGQCGAGRHEGGMRLMTGRAWCVRGAWCVVCGVWCVRALGRVRGWVLCGAGGAGVWLVCGWGGPLYGPFRGRGSTLSGAQFRGASRTRPHPSSGQTFGQPRGTYRRG